MKYYKFRNKIDRTDHKFDAQNEVEVACRNRLSVKWEEIQLHTLGIFAEVSKKE